MGCGSSSMKGEKVGDLAAESTGPPARKIRTNFSDVDFSSGAANDRRGTMAVAPDEQQRRMTKVSETNEAVPMQDTLKTPTKSNKASIEKARQGHAEPPKTGEHHENMGNTSGQVSESIDTNAVQNRSEAAPEIHMDGRPSAEGKLVY